MNYEEFLKSKKIQIQPSGFCVESDKINPLLFDFQRDIVKWALFKGKSAIFAGTGLGKCHGINTPILMYDGTIKMVQDIKAGDLLMGASSFPRLVLNITVGNGKIFKIIPTKGDPFTCNEDHILNLRCTANHSKRYVKYATENISLKEYLQKNDKYKHMMKLWRTGVYFNATFYQPELEPYFVGLWLGDGAVDLPVIYKNELDIEICEYLKSFAFEYKTGLRIIPETKNNTTKWYFSNGANGGQETWITKNIRKLYLNNEKRIPKEYLTNSREVRLDVLAGLLDTDGHLIDNVYEISTKYSGLSEDILFLARSLGFAAYCHKEVKTINSIDFEGNYYRIHISGNTHLIPLKLQRKKATERNQKKDVLNVGFDVEYIGEDKYYGFELDGDGLYLLGDFTVTHNTLMQLEWAKHVCEHTNGNVLILAPLAVAQQTVREGLKLDIEVTLCRTQNDVKPGINITNYEMMQHFDELQFIGIVLDESSILKSFDSKTKAEILIKFRDCQYKLACTATPAPNDHMELGNHAEFLGVMSRTEMLSTFFVHDMSNTQDWRLKKHAKLDFWRWVASWAVMLRNPIDLGYDNSKFDLPELRIHEIVVDKTGYVVKEAQTLQERRAARKDSVEDRVSCAAMIANRDTEPCLIWCNLNYESEMLTKATHNGVEVTGSQTNELKSDSMLRFSSGEIQTLISKPSICGFGMNWQHCHKMIFVGLSDSFEQYYQAVRRCWRFGQTEPVDVYIITSEKEGAVVKNIKRKEKEFEEMLKGMISATSELTKENIKQTKNEVDTYKIDCIITDLWSMVLGDNVNSIKKCGDNSIGYILYSPPFSSLYTYSNSEHDMGNCRTDEEFFNHFKFLTSELFRVLMPGRLMSCHCMNLPTSKERDGIIGIKDFRGDLIRLFQSSGFTFHSEVVIWKDPVTAMQRTKALGLLHKQLKKDSCRSRQGIPDYIITFRKNANNPEPVTHTDESFPVDLWQKYASPVWFNINQSDTLQKESAREFEDERHICPLQLEVIRRCLELWTNPNDIVLDPFAGIGSTGYEAIKSGRKFLGFELKESYYNQAVGNLKAAEIELAKPKQKPLGNFGFVEES